MKYLILTLSFVAAIFTFTACEPVDLNSQVDYYISFSESDKVDQLAFSFSGARAHQVNTDGSESFRTVYLDDKPIAIKFGEPQEAISLGSSDIEPSEVKAFDLFWGSLSAKLNNEPLELNFSDLTTAQVEIPFSTAEDKTVTFVVDLDASLVKQADGNYKFEPVIEIVVE
ncbi:MAG: hypothetical protein AB8H47_08835 [Bacteroidia bacterium]